MKRNWPIIGVLIAGLLAYEFFVLAPHNREIQEQAAAAKKLEEANKPKETAQSVPSANDAAKVATSETNVAGSSVAVAPGTEVPVLVDAQSFQVTENKTLHWGAAGSIGRVRLDKYVERESESEEKVVILDSGLHWASSNAQAQACLQSLKGTQNAEGIFYNGRAGGVTCTLSYIKDTKINGLFKSSVEFSGLSADQGSLELFLNDSLGGKNVLEHRHITYRLDGEVDTVKEDDLFESNKLRGKFDWLSWGNKYFGAIIIPEGKFNPDVIHKAKKEQAKLMSLSVSYPILREANKAKYEFGLYFGTIDVGTLKSIRPDLVQAVELGWFGAVGRFMLWCLQKLNLLFANFGWSIIALTFLVRVFFWPLNRKVFESGQKMKDLQPKMEAIRKKYGKDKSQMEQMNREIMGLYKDNKVNPMGSCMPMLLQMPIFIGLYGALNNSVALYQSPFAFWIQDLSYKDPYYVLPLLWTLSLMLSMKLTPQPTQTQPGMPDMKKVMFVMYIVFGFMSKDWPAGLTLYLLVSNIVGVAQQMVFRRGQKKNLAMVQEGA